MVQLQVLNKLLIDKSYSFITLNNLDKSYFDEYPQEFEYIENHFNKYGKVPDRETFISQFPNFDFIDVQESAKFLYDSLAEEHLYKKAYNVFSEVSKEMQTGDSRVAISKLLSRMPELTTQLSYEAVDLIKDADERFNEYVDKGENFEKYYIPSGLTELDKIIGGWDKSNDLVAICARPGIGKSWWIDYFAINAAKAGKTVGLYSGEMSESQVGYRIDTFESHISNYKISKGFSDIINEYKQHIDKIQDISGKLLVCTPKLLNGSPTVSKLRGFCEKYKIDILFVDQYSLLTTDKYVKNRTERFEQVSLELKMLQSELQIPVICACQLNRGAVDNEVGKDPGTENIAGSDRIAQDSSIVITILQGRNNTVTLNVIKSRSGVTGDKLEYNWDIDKGILNYIPNNLSNADKVAETTYRKQNNVSEPQKSYSEQFADEFGGQDIGF